MDGPRNYDCAMTAMISDWREELYRRTQGSTDLMLPVGIVQVGNLSSANACDFR